MARTQKEIQKLKENWKNDPIWVIEDTEGFEDHVEELLNFRKKTEAEWDAEAEKHIADHAEKVLFETGIADGHLFSSLHTFSEIEKEVAAQDRYIGTFGNVEDQVLVELKQAQVRATLLQSAQLKRIADALELMAEDNNTGELWEVVGNEQ